MDINNDLLESLNLFQNKLSKIESARQQVEKTVRSNQEVMSELRGYTLSLSEVSELLLQINNTLNNNKELLTKQVDKTLTTTVKSFDNKVNNSIDKFIKEESTFVEDLVKLHKNYETSIKAQIEGARQSVEDLSSLKNEISKHSEGYTYTLYSLEASVGSIKNSINQLLPLEQNNANNINFINQSVNSIDQRLSLLEKQVNANQGKIEQNLSNIKDKIELQQDVYNNLYKKNQHVNIILFVILFLITSVLIFKIL